MKKLPMILVAILAVACLAAMPFLCTHSSMLPEKVTEYYAQKAKEEAMNATGPEAELMRMLLGMSAAPVVEEPEAAASLSFSWFGMILVLGAVLSLAVMFALGWKQLELRNALAWTALLAVPFGLLGARLVYCLVDLPFYVMEISDPAAMLKIWEGGLSLAGALPFMALAGVLGAKLGKVPAGRILDTMAVPMVVMAIVAVWAAKVINMGYGPEFDWLFSVEIDWAPRLDTAWLVSIVLAVMLIIAGLVTQKKTIPAGYRFALLAFLYGTVMILMESLRRDGHMLWGFVHAEMLLDLFIALPALLYLAGKRKRILLALCASAALTGAVIALEFALDRAAIGDGWLYLVYIAVLGAYLGLGCTFAKKNIRA